MADDVKLLFTVDPASQGIMNSQIQAILRSIGKRSKFVIHHAKFDAAAISNLKLQIENALNDITIRDFKINTNNQKYTKASDYAASIAQQKLLSDAELRIRKNLDSISSDRSLKGDKEFEKRVKDFEEWLYLKESAAASGEAFSEKDLRYMKEEAAAMEDYTRAHRDRIEAEREEIKVQKDLDRAVKKEAAREAERERIRDNKRKNSNASVLDVEAFRDNVRKYIAKNPRAADTDFGMKLVDIEDELNRAAKSARDANKEFTDLSNTRFKELKGELKSVDSQLTLMGKKGDTLTGKIQKMYAKYGGWTMVTGSIYHAVQGIRVMVDHIRDIDSAMTELKKVTNETDATYSRFLEGATDRAEGLGVTIADTVNATADFARMDYSLEEATELADAALVYKNVGDGIDDISVASQSIISTMKAFGIEAEGAMLIVDKFNEVKFLPPLTVTCVEKGGYIGETPETDNREERLNNVRIKGDYMVFANDYTEQFRGLTYKEICAELLKLGFSRKEIKVKEPCCVCGEDVIISPYLYNKQKNFRCDKHKSTHPKGKNSPFYKRIITKCSFCGKEIEIIPYEDRRKNSFGEANRFCSQDCYYKFRSVHYVGDKSTMKGHVYTDKQRKNLSKGIAKGMKNRPQCGSKIQRTVDEWLKNKNINFEKEYVVGYYACDNFISLKNNNGAVIEVMGDYWHGNPMRYNADKYKLNNIQAKTILKDKQKLGYIRNHQNYPILYLWETDINLYPQKCNKLIDEFINTNGNLKDYNSFNYYIDEGGNLLLSDDITIPYQYMESSKYNYLIS